MLWDEQGKKTPVVPPGWKARLDKTKTLTHLDATLTRLGNRGQNQDLKTQLKATVNCFAAVFPPDLDVTGHFLRQLLPPAPTILNADTAPTFYLYESLLAQDDVSLHILIDVKGWDTGSVLKYVVELQAPFIKTVLRFLSIPAKSASTLYHSMYTMMLKFGEKRNPTALGFKSLVDQTLFPTTMDVEAGSRVPEGQTQQGSHFAVTARKLIRAPLLLILNGMDIKSVPNKISLNHLASKAYRSDMLIVWYHLKAIQVEYKEE